MTEHDVTIDGARRCCYPAAGDPRVEQVICGGSMAPPGAGVDRTKSRRIEHQIAVGYPAHDIVRVLVLDDDLEEVGSGGGEPRQDIFERRERHPSSLHSGRAKARRFLGADELFGRGLHARRTCFARHAANAARTSIVMMEVYSRARLPTWPTPLTNGTSGFGPCAWCCEPWRRDTPPDRCV